MSISLFETFQETVRDSNNGKSNKMLCTKNALRKAFNERGLAFYNIVKAELPYISPLALLRRYFVIYIRHKIETDERNWFLVVVV